jgi:hypothetical protein
MSNTIEIDKWFMVIGILVVGLGMAGLCFTIQIKNNHIKKLYGVIQTWEKSYKSLSDDFVKLVARKMADYTPDKKADPND